MLETKEHVINTEMKHSGKEFGKGGLSNPHILTSKRLHDLKRTNTASC